MPQLLRTYHGVAPATSNDNLAPAQNISGDRSRQEDSNQSLSRVDKTTQMVNTNQDPPNIAGRGDPERDAAPHDVTVAAIYSVNEKKAAGIAAEPKPTGYQEKGPETPNGEEEEASECPTVVGSGSGRRTSYAEPTVAIEDIGVISSTGDERVDNGIDRFGGTTATPENSPATSQEEGTSQAENEKNTCGGTKEDVVSLDEENHEEQSAAVESNEQTEPANATIEDLAESSSPEKTVKSGSPSMLPSEEFHSSLKSKEHTPVTTPSDRTLPVHPLSGDDNASPIDGNSSEELEEDVNRSAAVVTCRDKKTLLPSAETKQDMARQTEGEGSPVKGEGEREGEESPNSPLTKKTAWKTSWSWLLPSWPGSGKSS